MRMTGKIGGYDPGGNGRHGVATLAVADGKPVKLTFDTVRTVDAALQWLTSEGTPLAVGIDTLTVLSTGESGLRPADRWLRTQYRQARLSVTSPNSLRGAMALNGLALMICLRAACNSILISETHPKVLYFELMKSKRRHNYRKHRIGMNRSLLRWIGLAAATRNDHEWDAVISCFAVFQGMSGRWPADLHRLPTAPGESLVEPSGPSHYYWPLSPNQPLQQTGRA